MSSNRIVLVDPLGEILFSGESMSAREAAPPARAIADGDADMCPETMRSAGSGVYRAAVERRSVYDEKDVPTQKRAWRAA
jgi:hypothetical protein